MAYDTNLDYICATEKPCTVIILVDAISRKYFTGETSWLWDIDFDRLSCPQVEKVACYDTAAQAAEALKAEGDEDIYVLTCFSDRDKLLSLTEREDQ